VPIESVVADANVLLSAVTGRAALKVVTEFGIKIQVARFNAEEVAEYLPELAAKYSISSELLEMHWRVLAIELHDFSEYRHHFARARTELAHRDPEDAHALALARHLAIPLWSNDRDFEHLEIERYPTAKLLAVLKRERDAKK
jgi:predicted nucleic acid-binding protein